MTELTREISIWVCIVLGLGWWFGVEVCRGRSDEHSARVYWLHLTAPIVAIVLLLLAIWLLLGTNRIRRARGFPERLTMNPAARGEKPIAGRPEGLTHDVICVPVKLL